MTMTVNVFVCVFATSTLRAWLGEVDIYNSDNELIKKSSKGAVMKAAKIFT